MTMPSPPKSDATPRSEARHVLAVAAGFVVFAVGIALIYWISGFVLGSSDTQDYRNWIAFILIWVVGSGLISIVGEEVARAIEPRFNLTALVVLWVLALVVVFGVILIGASLMPVTPTRLILAIITALIGTFIGILMSVKQMRAPRKASAQAPAGGKPRT
jgi:Putative manganese efflux pump